MNTLFPSSSLSFSKLLDSVGPDIEPIVSEFEEHQRATRRSKLKRGSKIYGGACQERCPHAFMHDFIWCFGEYQKSMLYEPLYGEWISGRWSDEAFGAFLRALIKTGGHTSGLLDAVSVRQLTDVISTVPKKFLHMPTDLAVLEQLPERVVIHRGGWANSAGELVERSVSWTLDPQTAEEFVALNFTSFCPGQRPYHLRTEINVRDVLMCYEAEDEVIVAPDRITSWEEIQSREVIKGQPKADFYSRLRAPQTVG